MPSRGPTAAAAASAALAAAFALATNAPASGLAAAFVLAPAGRYRRVAPVPLPMASGGVAPGPRFEVVLQKVVRPPARLRGEGESGGAVPLGEFLGDLVAYLEDGFEVPAGLPVTYEKATPGGGAGDGGYGDDPYEEFDGNDGEDGDGYTVLSLDSPLSSDPAASRMEVEVVAVCSDGSEETGTEEDTAAMAMVVVRRPRSASDGGGGGGNLMISGLFDDARVKVLRALDRGLDDWSEGRIGPSGGAGGASAYTVSRKRTTEKPRRPTGGGLDEDGDEARLRTPRADADLDQMEVEWDKAIIDAEVVKIESSGNESKVTKLKKKQKKKVKSKGFAKPGASSSDTFGTDDFAVRAATMTAEAAQKRKKLDGASTPTKVTSSAVRERQSQVPLPLDSLAASAAANVEISPAGPRFRMSLNRPTRPGQARKERRVPPVRVKKVDLAPKQGPQKKVQENKASEDEDYAVAAAREAMQAKAKAKGSAEASSNSKDDSETASGNKVNVFEDEGTDFDNIMLESQGGKNSVSSNNLKTKSDAEIEEDIMAEAVKFMPNTEDTSAEQLLKDVLKFGEEKDKEEAPGTGFAAGAFDKAREIMRETQKERQQPRTMFKEPSARPEFFDNIEDEGESRPLTEEEELKKLFAAGERAAEGRMVSSAPKEDDPTVTEEYIDELIASDKTVPLNARVLDEQLAQLEVRVGKTVDEDGVSGRRGPNPLFDVMSGPEQYNPNVDPMTAVNWPGAQPGTRTDIRVPPELGHAVRNAKFAAKVITEMREETDSAGKNRRYFVGDREFAEKEVADVRKVVEEGVAVGIIEDPLVRMAEKARLDILVRELKGQDDRFDSIASEYKDLLLSDNLIPLVREYLSDMISRDLKAKEEGNGEDEINARHEEEREIVTKLLQYAQMLLKQVRALGAELEASHLEVIRSICHVAMDPSHETEEETSTALTYAVQDMRAMFDDSFVAYLKYAVAEEEGRLARAGVLDDPEHNRWLFVLRIIQEGVYQELAKSVNRLIEHIWYILRFESKSERRALLEKLVDVMPTMDVRPFKAVVDNIVASLGGAVRGEYDASQVGEIGDMTNKLLQLHRDVGEVLSPERVRLMSRDADEWAERRRQKLMEAREETQKRIANAVETDGYDPDDGPRGEIERMT